MPRLPEDVLEERIRLWHDNNLINDFRRVISFNGKPGAGKTCLLRYVEKQNSTTAAYVDMENRHEYNTPIAFVEAVQKQISSKKLLLLDHVPDEPHYGVYLEELEKQVLIPCFEGGGLLISAQMDPQSWCWEDLPHLPVLFELKGFDLNGRMQLFDKYKIITSDQDRLFNLTETLPLLVKMKSKYPQEEGRVVEEYLRHWLRRFDYAEDGNFEQQVTLCGAMTWLDTLADKEGIRSIVSDPLQETVSHLDVVHQLAKRGWIASTDEWQEPARTLLKEWVRYKRPDLAKSLDEKFPNSRRQS